MLQSIKSISFGLQRCYEYVPSRRSEPSNGKNCQGEKRFRGNVQAVQSCFHLFHPNMLSLIQTKKKKSMNCLDGPIPAHKEMDIEFISSQSQPHLAARMPTTRLWRHHRDTSVPSVRATSAWNVTATCMRNSLYALAVGEPTREIFVR